MPCRARAPVLLTLLALSPFLAPRHLAQNGPPWARAEIASSHLLHFGASTLQIDFAAGPLDLPPATILQHFQAAASALTAYYGRFPVARARVLLIPVPGRSGILQGTTWPHHGDFQAFTRIRIGQHTTPANLADDWMATHEMVHMAYPSLNDNQHWMEEGQATYIEPIARVMTGELDARQIWRDMVRDMPKGEPHPGDQGLDHTPTWGRTYWGGALFCLVADITIRRQTHNRKGLQDALRAVVAAGGTIDHDWPLPQALDIGDRATGTHVLTQLYSEWKDKPVPVDLPQLWVDLGIRSTPNGSVEFIPTAPLASIREAVTGERVLARPAAGLQ